MTAELTKNSYQVHVDLHKGFRDRDTLSWQDLFEHSYTVELNSVPIRVLCDEDNLRITAAHWLIDGGVYESRLWDIYYLVQNRRPDFDWKRCLEAGGPVRRTWVLAAISTAREYLDLDVSGLPDSVRNFELPSWYKKTLETEWKRGGYLRIPFSACIGNPTLFVQQFRRRFPPNKIAATTDSEGPIDESRRIKYQIRSVLKKIRHSTFTMLRRSDIP